MLEKALLTIQCPECGCPWQTQLIRVQQGAGGFCPACQVHVSFVDVRAGATLADRAVHSFFDAIPQSIKINIQL
jgi:uncharacterized Zn finger protein (UPF0148 family)